MLDLCVYFLFFIGHNLSRSESGWNARNNHSPVLDI
jgi:hypothetical protein